MVRAVSVQLAPPAIADAQIIDYTERTADSAVALVTAAANRPPAPALPATAPGATTAAAVVHEPVPRADPGRTTCRTVTRRRSSSRCAATCRTRTSATRRGGCSSSSGAARTSSRASLATSTNCSPRCRRPSRPRRSAPRRRGRRRPHRRVRRPHHRVRRPPATCADRAGRRPHRLVPRPDRSVRAALLGRHPLDRSRQHGRPADRRRGRPLGGAGPTTPANAAMTAAATPGGPADRHGAVQRRRLRRACSSPTLLHPASSA